MEFSDAMLTHLLLGELLFIVVVVNPFDCLEGRGALQEELYITWVAEYFIKLRSLIEVRNDVPRITVD